MRIIFAASIFISAAMLFVVQPLAGRILLPLLGGSPAVWNTAMVFFQGALLAGYLYVHGVSRLPRRVQPLVHLCALAVSALTLPVAIDVGEPAGSNAWWVLKTLALSVGPAFIAASASAPLLQSWYSRLGRADSHDPYFLYAASNAGSMIGLLGYPLLVEPLMSRQDQSMTWAFGYWGLLMPLVLACGAGMSLAKDAPLPPTALPVERLGAMRRVRWIILAAVPSSLMLGVTQHLTTDVASVPLLWVLPLALYLLSYVLAYSGPRWGSSRLWGRVLPFGVIPLVMVFLADAQQPIGLLLPLHLGTFFAASMMCHRRLAEDRPAASRLTGYYLCLSLGGVLGGAATALLAPAIFDRIAEYPLAIGAACLLRPQMDESRHVRARRWMHAAIAAGLVAVLALGASVWLSEHTLDTTRLSMALRAGVPTLICALVLLRRGSIRFAWAAGTLMVLASVVVPRGHVVHRERTFFGVHRVSTASGGKWISLWHGTTLHGIQARFMPLERVPTTYYHPSGPLGDVVTMLEARGALTDAAFVGLGAGSAAAYAKPGMRFTFYEIDPAVARIAQNPDYFTFLSGARAACEVRVADGRLGLSRDPDGAYDLIVIDAFSSDAIPVHLITREAIALYRQKLRPRGVLLFHVSSRFFDLTPVLAGAGGAMGMAVISRNDDFITEKQAAEGKFASTWVALANDREDLGPLARLPNWERHAATGHEPLWTDDYSNILGVLRWR